MKQSCVCGICLFRYPCVYLACKVEEFNVTITNFVSNMPQFEPQEAVDIILSQELLLMQMLYYHLTVHNPYRPVEGLLIDIKVQYTHMICRLFDHHYHHHHHHVISGSSDYKRRRPNT